MGQLADDVANAADKAVKLARMRPKPLDYTESSLEVVEKMLAEAAPYYAQLSQKEVEALVQQFGCYILEVGRRAFGGTYSWYEEKAQPVLVVGEPTFHVAMLAWDKVKGRLSGDSADNISFFYKGFADRARSAAPGTRVLYV